MPVIPSRYENINCKIRDFNSLIESKLVHMLPKVSVVGGSGEFADFSRGDIGTLSDRFARCPDPCGLHLNELGICYLVRNIKLSIFRTKKGSKVRSNRPYSDAVCAGSTDSAT